MDPTSITGAFTHSGDMFYLETGSVLRGDHLECAIVLVGAGHARSQHDPPEKRKTHSCCCLSVVSLCHEGAA